MNTENKKPENPVAFPHGYGTDVYERAELGMSLRDYFAAKAMQGSSVCTGTEFPNPNSIAKWSYAVADAMLKERENVS